MNNQGNLNIYALLVGINYYFPNTLSDGSSYSSLQGAVRDINLVESFLTEIRQVSRDNIFKLTASASPHSESPLESPEHLPTYKNIVASTGDQVYIHYSGHGGRTPTLIPELKGENGTDESIVPTDIGLPEGQYLRDIELAKLLQDMVDKGLIVTIVLDSCHSGGATRGEVNIRGVDTIDETSRPTTSLVADLEDLKVNWSSLGKQANTKGLHSSLVSNTNDYVLLAACRPNEFAFEYVVDREKGNYGGALTNFLLESFRQLSPNLTYKDVYESLHAKIHSKFSLQTPMLVGNGNRVVLGSEYEEKAYHISILQVDAAKQRILLQVGESAGFWEDDQFAIYPQGADFSQIGERIAIATITECGVTESWCTFELINKETTVKQADQAVPLAAPVDLVKQVLLWYKEEATPEEINQKPFLLNKLPSEVYAVQEKALEAVKNALEGNGWVELVTDESEAEEIRYQVAVNEKGEYEICDRSGQLFPNLRPTLKVDDPNSAVKVVKRLVHLAKYHSIEELKNFDSRSPLLGKLEVEWLGKAKRYSPAKPIPSKSRLDKFDDSANPTIEEGEWIFLQIKNNSDKHLNITVLDLESDWAVEQVHPYQPGENLITLSPGQEEKCPFQLSLPEGYREGRDIAKVFATLGSANFRYLELPSLDQPLQSKSINTKASNPLEEILSKIDESKPSTRKLNPAKNPSLEWITVQISVTVKKSSL